MASSGYSLGFASGTDIPVENLSYDYVEKCTDGSELEKILKILRSGKEGVYPDLIKTTEDHLRQIKPNSKLLIKAQNFTKVTDLPHEEWKTVDSDLQQWEQIISREDDSLSTHNKQLDNDIVPPSTDLPPIRKGGVVTAGQKQQQQNTEEVKPTKHDNPDRIKSFDFKSWDKYDVDKEMKKMDETSNNNKKQQQQNGPSSTVEWNKELTEKEKAMSQIERQKAAQREREKGNEAFKAGDHDEAMAYYSRSIKLYPDAAAYNNRALVCIKMKKYEQAMSDCKEALKRDPNNPKALLRCATACEALKDYHEAIEMCERLLQIEPNNKRCQELLSKVRQSYVPDISRDSNRKAKGKRITIEEVDGQETTPTSGSTTAADKGKEKNIKETDLQKTASNDLTTPTINQSPSNNTPFVCSTGEISEKGSMQKSSTTPTQAATPTPPPPSPLPTNVQSLKDKGNELFKVGQYGTALTKYTSAIDELEKCKGNHTHSLSTLYGNRAACHLKNGDCRSCIDDSSKAIGLSPSNTKAIMRRGMAYEMMEKYRHAFVDYQLILRVDSRFDQVQQSLSRLTQLLRDQDGSKWRDKLPPNPDEQNVLTAFYSSSASSNINQAKQDTPTDAPSPSPTTTNKSTERNNIDSTTGTNSTGTGNTCTNSAGTNSAGTNSTGTNSTVGTASASGSNTELTNQEKYEEFRLKGNQFVKQGDYNSALHLYTSCINTCPSLVAGYTNRALCHLKLGKYEKCDEDCSRALELEPKNVKALYRRALARKETMKYQESLKDLKLVIELDSKNTGAKKEKDIVHDLYLKELRQLQASNTDGKASKKVGGASNKDTTSKKSAHTKRDHKSRNSPTPQSTVTTATTSSATKSTNKGGEKKRKKVHVEEVKDEEVGTSSGQVQPKKEVEPKQVRVESKPKEAKAEPKQATMPEINLHDIKAEETNVGNLIQLWNSVPRTATPLHYAQLLLKINPSLLEQVISNKLEGHILTNIIAAVDQYLLPEGFHKFTFNVLLVLSKVSRFSVVKMFLSTEEKKVLLGVFDRLSEDGCIEQEKLKNLRGKYSL